MHKCSKETHDKCENSALCHLCDGVRLYKNKQEERAQKMKQREQNKLEQRNAAFRTHKDEKKEGMAFEKVVTKKWNAAFQQSTKESNLFKQSTKKTMVQKPRIQVDPPEVKEEVSEQKVNPVPTISLSTMGSTTTRKEKPIVDAKRQVNSGALWYAKGDIKTQDYLMECKERGTVNARGEKTISIPKDWLTKQELEAFQENRPYWVLPFRYKNDESIYLVKSFDQEIEMYQEMRKLREEIAEFKNLNSMNV
ncbi:hypothetical protein ACFX4N_24305 [Priestia sp. YIM B13551]|uniref:hypothetical protein n=1 Tax=Priestia sp. YIM B13551 TaxID=3366306 RepID=UPI00366F89A9